MKPIIIVQGAQWGSEAKGAIAGYLCQTRKVDYAVRTGATNAGHTVYYTQETEDVYDPGNIHRDETPVKLQQLPVGFVNPDTELVIGAGALIDPFILEREVRLLSDLTGRDIRERLTIDYRAALHLPTHAERSAASGRHHKMGATGKGCSEALIDRIRNRGEDFPLFGATSYADGYNVCDTEKLLNYVVDEGGQVLLEGTQGQLLDLYLGPYPYVTHKQTGPAQWLLECGLSPALPTEIVAVVRTFPIRVAGNSGPMPQEISWMRLANEINTARIMAGMTPICSVDSVDAFEEALRLAGREYGFTGNQALFQHEWENRDALQVPLSELNTAAWKLLPGPIQQDLSRLFEMTTVTKKLRRIARLDMSTLQASFRQMRPHWVALTFANYVQPQAWFATSTVPYSAELFEMIRQIETMAPVKIVSFGPGPEHVQVKA